MKLYAVALALVLPCLAGGPEFDKGKAVGVPTAPITIEIFSDFTCPHCKVFHEQIVPQLMRDYVDSGKLYLVDRAFVLNGPGHEHSREAFAYATAAARIGQYAKVADALYANQATWAINGNVAGVAAAALAPADRAKVQALLREPGVVAEIEREYQYGVAAGVNQTPTLMLTHGSQHFPVPNAQNYVLLKSLIDGYLK
jgi:protein-disulfide isomerase